MTSGAISTPTILGLGGVSCGGKTTITKRLKGKYGDCIVFHQDDYYWPPEHSYWKNDGTDNWDVITAFDMDRLIADVKSAQEKVVELIIVEGIMLYENQELDRLITHKVFITLPYVTCKSRRVLRNYEPPEPYPEYFDVVYWPMYLEQLSATQSRHDMTYIDASEDVDVVEKAVISHLTDSN